jgi:hypothetical protein
MGTSGGNASASVLPACRLQRSMLLGRKCRGAHLRLPHAAKYLDVVRRKRCPQATVARKIPRIACAGGAGATFFSSICTHWSTYGASSSAALCNQDG